MLQLVRVNSTHTHATKPIEKQEGYSGWLYIYIIYIYICIAEIALWLAVPGYNALSIIFLTHTCSILTTTVSVQQEERITIDGC